MDDGYMNCYLHYILVNPSYKYMGIDKQMLEMIEKKYIDFLNVIAIPTNDILGFFTDSGFSTVNNVKVMTLK